MAITAVGSNVTYGVWLSRAGRDPRHLPFALRGVKMLDDRLANPAYALLLVTGVAMIYAGRARLDHALAACLAVPLWGAGRARVGGIHAAAAAADCGPGGGGFGLPAYQRLSGRGTLLGALIAVVVLVITLLMVTKPVLWG